MGGFIPSSPMFVGGNLVTVGKVSVIEGICWIVTGFEVGELLAGAREGGLVAGFGMGGLVAGVSMGGSVGI